MMFLTYDSQLSKTNQTSSSVSRLIKLCLTSVRKPLHPFTQPRTSKISRDCSNRTSRLRVGRIVSRSFHVSPIFTHFRFVDVANFFVSRKLADFSATRRPSNGRFTVNASRDSGSGGKMACSLPRASFPLNWDVHSRETFASLAFTFYTDNFHAYRKEFFATGSCNTHTRVPRRVARQLLGRIKWNSLGKVVS